MLCHMSTNHSISFALSWFITWDLWLWSIIDYIDWLSCSATGHLLVLQGLWYISINDTSCKSFNDSSLSNSWLANDDLKQQGGSGIALTEGTLPGMMSSMFLWCIFSQKQPAKVWGDGDKWSDITNLHCRTHLKHTGRKLDCFSIFVPGFGSPQVNILGPAILQSMEKHMEKHFSCIRSTLKSLFELSWTIFFFSYPFHVFHLFPSNSSDLIISANHWVQLPFPRHAGKICAIGLEGFIRALRVLARDLGRSKIMYVSTAQQKSPGKR